MQSQDFVSKTDFPGSLGSSKDISALTLESKAPSLKRKIDFGDSVTPQKRRILESYSTGDIRQVVAVYSTPKIGRHNTDLTNPTTKRLFREASDIFLKRKADAQLDPFAIKRITFYEPCNSKAFIWSLPAEILIAAIALLGAQDLRSVTQVSSLLREIAAPLFFLNRKFPTSPKDLLHIRLSAFSHFLNSVPHKSIRFITLFWNFNILTSPVLSQIVTLLEGIRASGVEELTCMGFCDKAVSPSVTGLARIQACVGPNNLKAFEASSRVFFSPELLPFTIQTIRLSRCLEKLRLSSIKLSSAQWDKLLRHLAIPTLAELRVDADSHDASPDYITSILQCCSNDVFIGHPFNDGSGSVPGAAGDSLALSAAWIQALPQVKRVTMRGYSATAAGDLINIMHSFAAGDVELTVDLQAAPDENSFLIYDHEQKLAQKVGLVLIMNKMQVVRSDDSAPHIRLIDGQINDSSHHMFLCKCARCCDIGGDGVPRNPGGKEVPTAMKPVHLLQAANLASSSECEASVVHLARQQLEPNTSRVDDLAAELFAITLTDDDANPDSHSKLWNSRSEVQQDKGKAYHSRDGTARFTVDDTQHIAQALQAGEKWRRSKAQVALDIVESRMDRARSQIFSATSRDVMQTIRNELAVITTAIGKVKHKVSYIVSRRSQLEVSCDDMRRLLCDKEDALPVSSEQLEFDSWAVSVVIFGIGRRHGEFLMGVLALILGLAMETQDPHSESRRQNTHSQIPRSMETALLRFKLDGQTTTYAVCPACNFDSANRKFDAIPAFEHPFLDVDINKPQEFNEKDIRVVKSIHSLLTEAVVDLEGDDPQLIEDHVVDLERRLLTKKVACLQFVSVGLGIGPEVTHPGKKVYKIHWVRSLLGWRRTRPFAPGLSKSRIATPEVMQRQQESTLLRSYIKAAKLKYWLN
ncbi:hypothetical protein EV424DRAFT_1346534 [Suillus variegatus]|nr:hypothetical protein EV424DRAFT_1346534 [Suillus variegatus]